MRILLVSETLDERSGWGRYTGQLREELIRRGHDIHVLTHADAPTQNVMRGLPRALALLGNPLRVLLCARALRHAIEKVKPDIVHITVEPYAMAFGITCSSCPVILTVHGTYAVLPLRYVLTRWLFTRALQRVSAIISVSRFTRTALTRHMPNIDTKIRVIPNGIRLPMTTPHVHGAVKHILFVGAVKDRKGVIECVDACAELRKRGVQFHVDIVGGYAPKDPYVMRLRTAIAAHNIADVVTLHGQISDEKLSAFYAQADLFIMLSRQIGDYVEGFGLVYIEANARGIPVIGSTSGGCPEAIQDGVSGYVCAPQDTATVAQRMEDILVRQTISAEKCVAWAEQHTIGVMATAIEETYRAASA